MSENSYFLEDAIQSLTVVLSVYIFVYKMLLKGWFDEQEFGKRS